MSTITHKRKLRNLEATLADLALLQEHFPRAFPPKGAGPVKPLKINIVADIENAVQEKGLPLTSTQIKRVLGFWCSRKFYYKSIVRSANRVDLLGNAAEAVSKGEKNTAQSKIDAINLNRMLSETPPV